MKITGIDLHVLLIPDYDAWACSSAQDDLVVEIRTDEGIVGIGETDTNPWVARECIVARGTHCMGLGLREMLLGADPMEPEQVWERLYRGSKMTGRRGALICALGAIDMALWDIKAQALGVPLHRLLSAGPPRPVTPYASLLPTGHTLTEYRESLVEKMANIDLMWKNLTAGSTAHGPMATLHRELHTLAGSAKTFGLPEVSVAARAAEHFIEPYSSVGALPAAPKLAEFEALLSELREAARPSADAAAAPPPKPPMPPLPQ
jgi:L-alanine-DL-glutamate epimerase-like enolase superfamily enzyme